MSRRATRTARNLDPFAADIDGRMFNAQEITLCRTQNSSAATGSSIGRGLITMYRPKASICAVRPLGGRQKIVGGIDGVPGYHDQSLRRRWAASTIPEMLRRKNRTCIAQMRDGQPFERTGSRGT